MADKLNANCSICGKAYHLCMSCKTHMELNPWKVHTDTSEHYKIYQIIHGYSVGLYTKDEAKSKLEKVDLSDLEDLREHIKNIIKDIMNDNAVEAEIKKVSTGKKKASKAVETD